MILSLIIAGLVLTDKATAQLEAVRPTDVWRNFEEVFDFAVSNGKLIAASNGGLLQFNGEAWNPLESPSGLREIACSLPVKVKLANGRFFDFGGPGADYPKRGRTLESGLLLDAGAPWPSAASMTPPPAEPYCVIHLDSVTYAGTNHGLFRKPDQAANWERVQLPSRLPVSRPNGATQFAGVTVIGGLEGLFVGSAGRWQKASSDSIRQIQSIGSDVWVLHGSGSLDKLSLSEDKLWPDVLFGAIKRPWASSISANGSELLIGGQEGWTERANQLTEGYLSELKGDVVQAVARAGQARWIASEKSGLLEALEGNLKCWNPGNGLTDSNVTAVLAVGSSVIAGTAHEGLFEISSDRARSVDSPTKRVTAMTYWKHKLIVGGMDGAWVREQGDWRPLGTNGEETTSLSVVGAKLFVTSESGLYFFD